MYDTYFVRLTKTVVRNGIKRLVGTIMLVLAEPPAVGDVRATDSTGVLLDLFQSEYVKIERGGQ